jgi:hypothetical protein
MADRIAELEDQKQTLMDVREAENAACDEAKGRCRDELMKALSK